MKKAYPAQICHSGDKSMDSFQTYARRVCGSQFTFLEVRESADSSKRFSQAKHKTSLQFL